MINAVIPRIYEKFVSRNGSGSSVVFTADKRCIVWGYTDNMDRGGGSEFLTYNSNNSQGRFDDMPFFRPNDGEEDLRNQGVLMRPGDYIKIWRTSGSVSTSATLIIMEIE